MNVKKKERMNEKQKWKKAECKERKNVWRKDIDKKRMKE